MLISHTWLAGTIQDNTDVEHFPHCSKFCCTGLENKNQMDRMNFFYFYHLGPAAGGLQARSYGKDWDYYLPLIRPVLLSAPIHPSSFLCIYCVWICQTETRYSREWFNRTAGPRDVRLKVAREPSDCRRLSLASSRVWGFSVDRHMLRIHTALSLSIA